MNQITFEDFQKVEITIGKVLSAEPVEGSPKLLKLSVDFAEEKPRQVISGIAKFFPDLNTLIGGSYPFITNLPPRVIMGLESQAMILAASTSLLKPTSDVPSGTRLS